MNNDSISRKALKKELEQRRWPIDGGIREVMEIIDNAPPVEPEKVLVANVTFNENKLKEIIQTEVIEKIKSGELVIMSKEREEDSIRWTDKVYLDNQGNIKSIDGCPTNELVKKCSTCKYSKLSSYEEPCISCERNQNSGSLVSKWEAKDDG